MLLVATILTAALVAWFLLQPFCAEQVTGVSLGRQSAELERLLDQKERCLQVIKDLELDHATNKVSKEDFERTRASLMSEMAGLLERIDGLR
jgi:hypothetical protein